MITNLQLVANRNLQIGDRIVVPKSSFNMVQHHAIFMGYESGQFWFIENKENIGVRIINAETFFSDVSKITRIVRFIPKYGYTRNDLYRKALSMVGRPYHLTKYNCESFANELQYGVVESKQAKTGAMLVVFLGLLFIVSLAFSLSNNKLKTN